MTRVVLDTGHFFVKLSINNLKLQKKAKVPLIMDSLTLKPLRVNGRITLKIITVVRIILALARFLVFC